MQPVAKYPKFLSPSSLSQFTNMPLTFYLTRMAPDPIKNTQNSVATCMGTAIDARIKTNICKKFDWVAKIRERVLSDVWDKPTLERLSALSLESIMLDSIPEEFAQAKQLGLLIGDKYCSTSMYESLNIVDIEYHPHFKISCGNTIPVPIYCKLDATVSIPSPLGENYPKINIPLDFKSTSGSPGQGYFSLFDTQPKYGRPSGEQGPHKLYLESVANGKPLAFSQLDESFDRQLLTYHMALNYQRNNATVDCSLMPTGLPAMIEQICISDRVRVARFLAACSNPTLLYAKYENMWTSIHNNSFTRGLIDDRPLLEYFAQRERFY